MFFKTTPGTKLKTDLGFLGWLKHRQQLRIQKAKSNPVKKNQFLHLQFLSSQLQFFLSSGLWGICFLAFFVQAC